MMKTLKIDEYLIVNLYTGKKRWVSRLPNRMSAYDVAVKIKGIVKIPDILPIIELGEIPIPDIEALAEAQMK